MCIKTNSPIHHHRKEAPVRVLPGMRKRRRTVHFASSSSSPSVSSEQQHSVLALLPLSSEYSPEERSVRWMSAREKEETSRMASMQAKEYRQLDAKREQQHNGNDLQERKEEQGHGAPLPSYRQTYNAVFTACHQPLLQQQQQDDKDSESHACSSSSSSLVVPPQAVALLAMQGIRGLEDRTLPLTALLRRKIRRSTIRRVVQASQEQRRRQQQQPQGKVSSDEEIASLYESMTRPASRFAHALGLADATSVLLMEQHQQRAQQEKENLGSASMPVAAAITTCVAATPAATASPATQVLEAAV